MPGSRSSNSWSPVRRSLLLCLLGIGMAACGGGGGGGSTTRPPDPTFDQGVFGFISTIVDAPTLAVTLFSSTSGGSSLTLPYGLGSLSVQTVAGFDVDILYADANNETQHLLQRSGTDNIKLFRDDEKIVWLSGTLANPVVQIIENDEYLYGVDLTANPDNQPQVQFFNGVTGQGQLDIYLTAGAADLAGATPLATLAESAFSPVIDVDASTDYRLRATPAGDKTTVLYDSGTFGLASNTRTSIFAINYFGPGANAVTMRPLRRGAVVTFANEVAPAQFRVRNVLADLDAIDVHVGTPGTTPVISALPFEGVSAYIDGTAGDQEINVTQEGITDPVALQRTVTLAPGFVQTIFVGGLFTDGAQSDARNVVGNAGVEDRRPIAGLVRIEMFQGSVAAGSKDIHFLDPGEDIAGNQQRVSLALGGVASVELPPGDYDLAVTNQGVTDTIILGPQRFSVAAGNYYTVLLEDAAGGGSPFSALIQATPLN
ncbi:MAG: DUF4397 domain-containing protein [Pseudomonadales bacterium]|nr:DUF4397 domain-containing protein [Pseudomonadales bacterium]